MARAPTAAPDWREPRSERAMSSVTRKGHAVTPRPVVASFSWARRSSPPRSQIADLSHSRGHGEQRALMYIGRDVDLPDLQ